MALEPALTWGSVAPRLLSVGQKTWWALTVRWRVGRPEGSDGGGPLPACGQHLHLQPVQGGRPEVGHREGAAVLRGQETRGGGSDRWGNGPRRGAYGGPVPCPGPRGVLGTPWLPHVSTTRQQ